MGEEYRTSSNFYPHTNIFDSRIPCSLPSIQCRDDLGKHGFDIAIENVFIGISQELMMVRLISDFWVRITRIGYFTYTYKQHHGISADML